MGQLVEARASAGAVAEQIGERLAGGAGKLVDVKDLPGRKKEWNAGGASKGMDLRHRLVAKAALGRVHDPLEGEVVSGLGDHPEVSERVPDLGAFVEAKAADDPVG